jgi:RNA polymerase sigma-70 factor (ECF subfamily)
MFSDEQLITNYFTGDKKSLEILINRYLKPIYNFVYRYIGDTHEAEDVTQEIFLKMWRNLKKFKKGKKFKTWLFTIAKNTCLDFLKKKKAILFSEFENEKGENRFIETLIDPGPLPNEIFEQTMNKELLYQAINQLPLKYRLILFLHYNNHFTFQEIAEIFNEPLNTIKSRHLRAILMLKKLLKINLLI